MGIYCYATEVHGAHAPQAFCTAPGAGSSQAAGPGGAGAGAALQASESSGAMSDMDYDGDQEDAAAAPGPPASAFVDGSDEGTGATEFVAFCRTALHECMRQEKSPMLHAYLFLHCLLQASTFSCPPLQALASSPKP